MIKSNLSIDVGLNNGAKSTVIDFVYKNAEGPRSGKLTESAVVRFCELDNEVMTFLPGVPLNVAIPIHRV